jgi:hypothetical protein
MRVHLQVMNELCGVVEQEGYLCTSPLADVPLPSRYETADEDVISSKDFNAYVRLLDSEMTHFHIWMVNIYRGNTFGTLFAEYAKVSGKPLLIGEYGVDAFDALAIPPSEDQQVCAPDTRGRRCTRCLFAGA